MSDPAHIGELVDEVAAGLGEPPAETLAEGAARAPAERTVQRAQPAADAGPAEEVPSEVERWEAVDTALDDMLEEIGRLDNIISRLGQRVDALESQAEARAAGQAQSGGPAPKRAVAVTHEPLSVEGLDLDLSAVGGRIEATFTRSKYREGEFDVCVPGEWLDDPVALVADASDRTWSVVPLRTKAGAVKLIAVLDEASGGQLSAPFESQYDESRGVMMAISQDWCWVNGWVAPGGLVPARQSPSQPASGSAGIEEPF